ncbi:MAG: hypothetical protein LUG26_08480 [Ruminococcus sp.]|nr:hypothetical protein [Ruminococcus sp.]
MKKLQKLLGKFPFLGKYFSDNKLKFSVKLSSSFAINLLYAAWEIGCGIYYQSYWFMTLGRYYILLMIAHRILLRKPRKEASKGRKVRKCGILLLFMNLILSGIVVLAVTDGEGAHYAEYFIYAVAMYTFYKVIISIRSFIKYRHFHNQILTASKAINFASAVISLLSLEIAMILQFGEVGSFFYAMTIFTGTGACLAISITAVYLIAIAK